MSGVAMAMMLTGCKAPGESNADDKGGGPRDAFAQAASALRDAPQFGYHIRTAGLAIEIRATREGAAIGTMTLAGTRTNVLTVGGKTYMRWHKAIPGAPSRPGQADLLKDKWVTGSAFSGMGRTLTPKQLGMTVAQELNQPGTRYPDRGDTVMIDGKPVWKASTKLSDVYVTSTAPHRVVRITPKGTGAVPGMPALPTTLGSLPLGALGTQDRVGRTWALTAPVAPAPAQIDVDELDQSEVDALFGDLVNNTRQLAKRSVDLSYQFNAMMTVSMTGSGTPVGGCATSDTLPVNSTGSLSCTNTSPAWASWYSARSQRGTHVYIGATLSTARGPRAESRRGRPAGFPGGT
ncbi:hypothetical protein AB0A05_35650 [Streptomyces sp. NPDC046374]|uniref:hypothetical protein n=1 Tax=Streptomyces sp. NPDC046374 TaxID=3154917 RepID=UPI00340B280B